jgi:DNA polymerase, archaea type
MAFAFDFLEDAVVEWRREDGEVRSERVEGYRPTIYVAGEERRLETLRERLVDEPLVAGTGFEPWRTELQSSEPERVLRVDVGSHDAPRALATRILRDREIGREPPGTYRLFNVDLAPGFRYCVETGTDPTPEGELRALSIRIGKKALADEDLAGLVLDGEPVAGDEDAVLATVARRLERVDPDVLVLSDGGLIPLLSKRALATGVDLSLGRGPGWRKLAGANTFESYGQVGHSPARYDVPGRAIVDTSNSFLWAESRLDGLLYLVGRSWRPLQEAAWGSIGTILTSIQVRKALGRGVLVPWQKWRPEAFKDVRTLHAADRGGFTFDPQVGFHEEVVEVDFASLYPRIIREYNVSPDTVLCSCHEGREDVPELGYNVCDEPGFLPEVLGPLLDDRARFKRLLSETDNEDEAARLRAKSGAIKWILVSCFGYQGYRNAKFGRIECHEAINAIARDLLLRSKEVLEANGWRVVHGIVDSLWVRPDPDGETAALGPVAERIGHEVGIALEIDAEYDWVCFVPRRGSDAGALMRYFGKVTGEDRYTYRGIECRQRSTPEYVAEAQRELIRVLDAHRDPAVVCDRAGRYVRELERGAVPVEELVVEKRVSKRPEEYTRETRTVGALRRYERHGMARAPGQSVAFVVVDDGAGSRERVRLPFEAVGYDPAFYRRELLRATESVVSPLGWRLDDIERHLRGERDASLLSY